MRVLNNNNNDDYCFMCNIIFFGDYSVNFSEFSYLNLFKSLFF